MHVIIKKLKTVLFTTEQILKNEDITLIWDNKTSESR